MFISLDNAKFLSNVLKREKLNLGIGVSKDSVSEKTKFLDELIKALADGTLHIIGEDEINIGAKVRASRGGIARAKSMTPEERSRLALHANARRWKH
jgi:dihydrodipicolinate synthase/N-acetylneuraminate lyase